MPNSGKITAGVIAASMAIAVSFISAREGTKLDSYEDVAGVWTICNGEAYVKPGTHYTVDECKKLTATTIGRYMDSVFSLVKVPLSPRTLAAHTSFAYNIGITAYKNSSILKLTNQEQLAEGCAKMMLYDKVGKKDCSIRDSGCYGVYERRKAETALCIAGL